MTRIVVVSGGLGSPSSTRLLGDRLAEAVVRGRGGGAGAGADAPPGSGSGSGSGVEVIELRDLAADIANSLVTGFPGPKLGAALDSVARADGVIAVTPVFSASYSGLFKSFFDVLDPEALAGTPVLIAAAGGTPRHSLVLEHAMRPLFAYLRAVVVPTSVYAASQDWGADGLTERIERAGAELAALAGALGAAPDSAADLPVPGARPASAAAVLRGEAQVVPFEQQLAAVRVPG